MHVHVKTCTSASTIRNIELVYTALLGGQAGNYRADQLPKLLFCFSSTNYLESCLVA